MPSVMTIILFTMLIKSTTSKCNVKEHQDTRWIEISCFHLTSPSEIEFTNITTNNFKKVLSIITSNFSRIPTKGFLRFPTINELWLRDIQIQELEEGAFDGLLNVEQIYIDQNKLTEVLEGVFTSNAETLMFLHMAKNDIKKVAKNAFKGLAHLNFLHLQENKIQKLEQGTFCDLTSLRVLGLNNNLLIEFKDYELFGNSTSDEENLSHNLGFLYLGNNRITSFVVKNLKKLQWIDFNSNYLSYIEPDSFSELSELRRLDLSYNFLKRISAQLLKGHFNLEFIYLENNNISILDRGVFQDLHFLVELDLSNNALTEFHDFDLWTNSKNIVNISNYLRDLKLANNSITSAFVSNSKAVRNVYFENNQLSNLKPDMFKDLPNMIELDMSNNPLVKSLPQQLFQGAVRLEGLFINNLTIVELPCGIFKDLKELENIGLANNRLEKFNDCCLFGDLSDRDYPCNSKLTNIFLDNNLILSVNLANSPNMQYIHLENNNISSLKNLNFEGLSKLKSLDLSNNIISKFFPNTLKGKKNLEKLNLGSNKISKLEPGTFTDQTQLTDLNISNNLLAEFKISDLWNGFESNLKTADLSKNLINSIHINSSKNLQSINLAFNNIFYMRPGLFQDLPVLTTLNLSHNDIQRIPFGVFQNLTNLQDLNLSYNRLKKFNHNFLSGKTNPKNLDLSNNQIGSFKIEKFKEHLTNLLSISLVNNSITCDALAQLEDQLQDLNATLVKGEAIDVPNIGGNACDAEEVPKLTTSGSISYNNFLLKKHLYNG